jgi:hypothetical protein
MASAPKKRTKKASKPPKPVVTSTRWYCDLRCSNCGIQVEITAGVLPGTTCSVACPFCRADLGRVKGVGRFDR